MPSPEFHATIEQQSESETIPVHRVRRAAENVASVMRRIIRPTEADLVEAGVMRVGAAQTAEVVARYSNPVLENLTLDQQNRAQMLVEQDIQRVR